jgi:putative restriction endonuclease
MPDTNAQAEASALVRTDDEQVKAIQHDSSLDTTTKEQVVLARHGQGLFRQRVLDLEKRCRLTKIENPLLLMASHIKPWRACATANERIDGANGLALAPHVDRLFDRGLIGFESDGTVLVSPRLPHDDLERLGLAEAVAKSCGTFLDSQVAFLLYHRKSVFYQ